jgi:response regulator NasT
LFIRFVSKEVNMSAVREAPTAQRSELDELRERVTQLQTALDSRVAIEQAKGVLMERFAVTPEAAFELLRRAARNNRESLQKLAALVTASPTTPASIESVRGGA